VVEIQVLGGSFFRPPRGLEFVSGRSFFRPPRGSISRFSFVCVGAFNFLANFAYRNPVHFFRVFSVFAARGEILGVGVI